MPHLPAALMEAALFPELDLPDPPPGHPYEIRKGDGYRVGSTKGTSFAMVFVRRLGDASLPSKVDEIWALLVSLGCFERAAWVVSEAAEPPRVAARLQELERLGFVNVGWGDVLSDRFA